MPHKTSNSNTAKQEVSSGTSRKPHHAHSLELNAICRAVVLGVVTEDSGAVKGAVILREVQPALEAVRALSSDA